MYSEWVIGATYQVMVFEESGQSKEMNDFDLTGKRDNFLVEKGGKKKKKKDNEMSQIWKEVEMKDRKEGSRDGRLLHLYRSSSRPAPRNGVDEPAIGTRGTFSTWCELVGGQALVWRNFPECATA